MSYLPKLWAYFSQMNAPVFSQGSVHPHLIPLLEEGIKVYPERNITIYLLRLTIYRFCRISKGLMGGEIGVKKAPLPRRVRLLSQASLLTLTTLKMATIGKQPLQASLHHSVSALRGGLPALRYVQCKNRSSAKFPDVLLRLMYMRARHNALAYCHA